MRESISKYKNLQLTKDCIYTFIIAETYYINVIEKYIEDGPF